MKKILLATLACAAFCACSDELDLGGGGISTPKVFESDKAYITVSISEAGSSSTRATDGGFQSSGSKEKAAKNAYFYFFDEDGVFVSDGVVLQTKLSSYSDSLLTGEDIDDNNKDSVYYVSPTQVVLKGLTNKKYPRYVVTVLNKPDDFYVGDSGETPDLTALEKILSRPDTTGIYDDSGTYFVMSTTSYCGQENEDQNAMPYCVTELQEADFHVEPVSTELDTIQAVNIFVERLAAKVNVSVDQYMEPYALKTIKGGSSDVRMYRLEESIAGDPNNEGTWSGGHTQGSYQDDVADMTVFVQLLGWQLNATARRSYMIKNMDEAWLSDDTFNTWTWNDPTYHRSYWGMSYNYGISSPAYPTNSNGNTDADEYETSGKQLNEYLKYISLKDTIPFGTSDDETVYCAENTNTAGTDGVIKYKNDPAITSAIVKARLFMEEEEGSETVIPLELIEYNGMLYTDTAYMNHVLNSMYESGELCIYKDDQGTKLDASYLIIKNMRDGDSESYSSITNQDGKIILEFDESQVDMNKGLYFTTNNGVTYRSLGSDDSDGGIQATARLNSAKNNLVVYNVAAEAYQYTNGYMWYNIPIEHLNEIDYDEQYDRPDGDDNPAVFTPEEANYGVVRNHHYTVTITSISNLGKPITDQDEVIVPDPDDYKDKYYIGADIWVSPWKGVSQNADL